MEGLELLMYWKTYIDLAIRQVWQSFNVDRKLLLTESDLKCNLYKYLTLQALDYPYQVHSEVTHHHQREDLRRRGWRFRDVSLLNPVRLHLNDEAENLYEQLSKGFYHQGEAVFMELKFQVLPEGNRQGILIQVDDMEKLKTYTHNINTPKMAYLIWGTQRELHFGENNGHDLVNRMITALTGFSNYDDNVEKIPFNQVFGYVFNPHTLYKVYYENGEWRAILI